MPVDSFRSHKITFKPDVNSQNQTIGSRWVTPRGTNMSFSIRGEDGSYKKLKTLTFEDGTEIDVSEGFINEFAVTDDEHVLELLDEVTRKSAAMHTKFSQRDGGVTV